MLIDLNFIECKSKPTIDNMERLCTNLAFIHSEAKKSIKKLKKLNRNIYFTDSKLYLIKNP